MSKNFIFKGAVAVLVVGVGVFALWGNFFPGGSGPDSDSEAVFQAKRGDLVIDVLEGGSIHALESLEVRNQVTINEGTKIISIIEEGYEITKADVKDGKVLALLDSAPVEEKIVDHDVEFQETQAAFAEAKQNLAVQASENTSEIKMVRQLARFALLDFEKFVGSKAAREILQALDLPYDAKTLAAFESEADAMIRKAFDTENLLDDLMFTDSAGENRQSEVTDSAPETVETVAGDLDENADAIAKAAAAAVAKVEASERRKTEDEAAGVVADPLRNDQNGSRASGVDFSSYLEAGKLGDGEAEQTIRRMQDEALVARTEMAVVEESVEGAIRLHKENFITTTTLENEKVALEKARLTVKTAETELDLFRDYEFPKEAEKMLSVFEEDLLELVREKREAMAQAKQAESTYRSRKRRYELELKKGKNLQEQLESCVIRAEKPGLVAYGGGNDNYYSSRYYEAISAGASLKAGQPIITIPDMANLAVDINIHESHIKKVQLGQRALIGVEAVANQTLTGTVIKLAVLPDSNASRYNPSLKVYPATVEIDGAHEWLKPGMTAKVEIIVNELEDVVYIPVQSIFVEDDAHFVFVEKDGKNTRRAVKVGDHNDEFIQILAGVEEGESVLLNTPAEYEIGDTPLPIDAATQLSSSEQQVDEEA